MLKFNKILFIFFVTIFPFTLLAEDNSPISYKNPWIKMIIGNSKVTSGYLKIKNLSKTKVKLIAISSDFCEKTEIHNMKVEKNVMKMNRVRSGISILPNKEVFFEPGGLHIMFININKKFTLDEIKFVSFDFGKNGILKIPMKVKKGTHLKKHKH